MVLGTVVYKRKVVRIITVYGGSAAGHACFPPYGWDEDASECAFEVFILLPGKKWTVQTFRSAMYGGLDIQ
jgi:hypothetical protein